ncbi:MAG TPA: hypothetical protein VFB28_00845 [Terriglobales bacterium]|nr:hypothetical protein [Terriglobales bacterium]
MARRILLVVSALLLCALWAVAQATERASVSILGKPCDTEPTHATCSQGGGTQWDSVFWEDIGSSNVSYGFVDVSTNALVYCNHHCQNRTGLQASSFFSDQATIQNAPESGAYFMIAVQLTGQTSSGTNADSTSLELDMNGGRVCTITVSSGYCHARLQINSDATVDFSVNLVRLTSASLDVISGSGESIGYGDLTGKITRPAVVDAGGHNIPGVTITTASGHQYPL